MREVLFRGKDKDDGSWYEGYYLQLHDTTHCCMPSDKSDEANRLNKENEHHYIVFERMTDWGLPNKHLRAEVDPSTVCQYTGLTDKNGRKIFEGDIVKTSQYGVDDGKVHNFAGFDIFSVEFSDGGFCLKNKWRRFNLRPQIDFELCGNIFGNPELIGE